MYHSFHYTGAGFSGLSFSISFSTRHHRKSSISPNMQCLTQTSYVSFKRRVSCVHYTDNQFYSVLIRSDRV